MELEHACVSKESKHVSWSDQNGLSSPSSSSKNLSYKYHEVSIPNYGVLVMQTVRTKQL